MKWLAQWRRRQFIPLELAAKIAYASLPRCDWTETIDWMRPNVDAVLYMANAFTLSTKEKSGQPQLVALPLYYDHYGSIRPIRPSIAGRVYYGWLNNTYRYLDDWQKEYVIVFVKRRDLNCWIARAKGWKYLTEERRR